MNTYHTLTTTTYPAGDGHEQRAARLEERRMAIIMDRIRTRQIETVADVKNGDTITVCGPYVASEPMMGEVVSVETETFTIALEDGFLMTISPVMIEELHVRLHIIGDWYALPQKGGR